jgi:hypothetical protein
LKASLSAIHALEFCAELSRELIENLLGMQLIELRWAEELAGELAEAS